MKKYIYARISFILIMIFLLCSCDNSGKTAGNVSEDTVTEQSISEEQIVPEPAPSATPTVKPTATPTPAPEPVVSADETIALPEVSENEAVSSDKATPTPLPAPDPAKITAFDPVKMYVIAQVNVRKGPGTEYEKVGLLNPGETITVTGKYGDKWMRVEYNSETEYVFGDYLSTEPPATPTPLPEQPPVQDVQPTPTPAPAAPPVQVAAPAGVLMIGDSRCVQMRDVTGGGGVSWI
ncbi:MAG: SH3 domain-containing protein [Lachnospiraceae bacterium]|nr:SH3 domain-containing protein [Lachnospiraceae bacterium]